jgi:hypothetical protein
MSRKKIVVRSLIILIPLISLCWTAGASRQDQGVKFEKPVNVSKNKNRLETQTAIAVDKHGVAHIAWAGYYYRKGAPDNLTSDIFYSNNKTGKFCTPQKIPVSANWYSMDPSIATDSRGTAHIVFCRTMSTYTLADSDIYYVSNVKGSFDAPSLIVNGNGEVASAPQDPLIHIDPDNNPCLSFRSNCYRASWSELYLLVMKKSGGKWSDPQLAYKSSWLTDYDSVIDGDGYFHVVILYFGEKHEIYYTHNRGGDFISPVIVNAKKHKDTGDPSIAVDSLGNAHVTYRDDTGAFGTPELYYTNNISGRFSTPVPLLHSDRLHFSAIDVDGHDFVHIAYKLLPLNGEGMMYYANNYTGKFIETAQKMTGIYWFHGSCFFTAGNSGSVHYGFWDFMGDVYDSDTEVFYLKGTCDLPPVPKKPYSLAATVLSANNIRLKWQDRSNNEAGFEVQRKKKIGGTWAKIGQTAAGVQLYLDQGLDAGTRYVYRVRAYNSAGNSLYSNTAQAETKSSAAPLRAYRRT